MPIKIERLQDIIRECRQWIAYGEGLVEQIDRLISSNPTLEETIRELGIISYNASKKPPTRVTDLELYKLTMFRRRNEHAKEHMRMRRQQQKQLINSIKENQDD